MIGHMISLGAGVIFAIGLSLSGMINPDKVIGFLDIFGNWDYALVFVMAGAVIFNFFSFRFLRSRKPICSHSHFWPTKMEVDKNLFIGSALFGIGWGLAGICPGPAIVNLVTLEPKAFVFVLSLVMGMFLFKVTQKLWE